MDAGPSLYLLPSKYVLVEVKLDLLVGDVDAELLERVLLKVLKAEDVQYADVQALFILSGDEINEKLIQFNTFFTSTLMCLMYFVSNYNCRLTEPKTIYR